MSNRKGYVANQEIELYSVIKGLINEKNYVNLCVITKVHNEDFVDVSLYYTGSSGKETMITDVRLLHLGTAKCKVTVEPDVGDYVLLVTPKDFLEEMKFNRQVEPSKEMYEPYANCNACGILVKSEAESEDDILTTLNVDLEGNITFDTNGKITATIGADDDDVVIDISTDDGISVTDYNDNKVLINGDGMSVEDTNGNKADLTSDGIAVEDANGNKVEMASGGVSLSTGGDVNVEATQTGLITLKNSIDSLGNIIATLIDHVNTFSQNVQSIDTVGSPASHSAGPGIIANMVSLQTQLAQLKTTAGQVLG